MSKLFGEKAFVFLMQVYLGLGRSQVQPAEEYERKSVGTESTFGDMSGSVELRKKLRATAEELEKDMRRTQFKGRTLVLKVKLHSYEVLTRQVAPPKAVCLADDLEKYSLPMLAKLEQDFPGLRLRLMGLRCTHLVSLKKPDTMSFFGFKQRKEAEQSIYPGSDANSTGMPKRKAETLDEGDEEWEVWDDELLFEDAERQEREDEFEETERLSQLIESDPRRHHGKEIVPNPKRNVTPEEEWWDCPICSRPQEPSEKEFNEHIDLCLSRQTIKEALQEESTAAPATPSTQRNLQMAQKPKTGNEKGKQKGSTPRDPKQRKLCFG